MWEDPQLLDEELIESQEYRANANQKVQASTYNSHLSRGTRQTMLSVSDERHVVP